MKIKAEYLNKNLNEKLLPVYLVSGDEPLLVQETCDQIRLVAKKQGFIERDLYHGDKGDVDKFSSASNTLSLFAEQKMVEFRLEKAPIATSDISKAFLRWSESPPEDQFLLISCPKLDKKHTNKPWYKNLEKMGAHIELWPVDSTALPSWLDKRAKAKGLNLEREVLNLLAERVEGNLLAAKQEIDRLSLLYAKKDGSSENISLAMMNEYVSDNARYNSFELLEATFSGDGKKLTRILTGLKLEGEAAAKINGLLTYELRNLTKMAWDYQQGTQPAQLMQKYYVWGNKKQGYIQSLKRYPVSVWQRVLSRCLELDKIIKGQQKGEQWVALESLLLQISGNGLWKKVKS